MSVDYNTFVGPYAEVYNPEKDSTEEYHTCLNPKCVNFEKDISDGFCSKCGARIERTSRPVKERIDFDWFYEFENDQFCEVSCEYKPKGKEDYMFFATNTKNGTGLHLDGRFTSAIEVDGDVIESEISRFHKVFSKEIEKLKKVFGKENVKVKWGVLIWCS